MASQNPQLSVIVPTGDEISRLPLTLVDIDRHLSGAKYSYEVLVVDYGSSEEVVDLIKRLTKLIPNIRLLRGTGLRGWGDAVKAGMLEASGKHRLFMSSDNMISVDHFDKAIRHLREGCGIVAFSRHIGDSEAHPPQSLIGFLLSWLSALPTRLLLVLSVRDPLCPFKVFSAQAAESIFSKVRVGGFGVDAEALVLAKKLGYGVKEAPASWKRERSAAFGALAYFQALWATLRVRFWLWRGKYALDR